MPVVLGLPPLFFDLRFAFAIGLCYHKPACDAMRKRAGRLVRYHSFLVNELMTVSWELYGSPDYAMHMIPLDGFVQSAVGGRSYKRGRTSEPFHNVATLPARAATVLKAVKVNTTQAER